MATKIDVNTGESVEVSDDELRKAIQSGTGTIKQVATLPDGTKKEVAIWGGYEMDGFDRTLNVFMKHADIDRFIDVITKGEVDPESYVDPCEYEEGYQVTVDFMDIAAMLILRRSKDLLSTEMYVRDERKTCRDAIEAGTGEIGLDDGNLSLDEEILNNNKFLIFALAILGVRRYLLSEGIVQKLYDMFDESAGVILKVSNGGNITARIVKGSERPELPCDVFLLGEQMCRPYIDEMLGLKSSGIRKPKDPEVIARMKADEAEKKKVLNKKELAQKLANRTLENRRKVKQQAEEAERKAAEEKRKAEEAKRKAEEERKRQEKARIEEEKRLEEKRRIEEELKRKAEEERREKQERIEKLVEEKKQVESSVQELKTNIEQLSKRKDGLGLFKGKEKKQLEQEIQKYKEEFGIKENQLYKISTKLNLLEPTTGDVIEWGTNINSDHKEAMKWYILDYTDENILLVCSEIVGFKNFNEAQKWVRDSLCNVIFSVDERKALIPLSDDPMKGASIFMLTPDEEAKYDAGNKYKAIVNPAVYELIDEMVKKELETVSAKDRNKWREKWTSEKRKNVEGYWLRHEPLKTNDVTNGAVYSFFDLDGVWKAGTFCFGYNPKGIRPAIRLDIEKSLSIVDKQ